MSKRLIIPWHNYNTYKGLLKEYLQLRKETEDVLRHLSTVEKDSKMWMDAYWKMMYNRYMGRSAPEAVSQNVADKFAIWLHQQIEVRVNIQDNKEAIKCNKLYLRALKRDLATLDKSIKRVRIKLEQRKRVLEMAKDPINLEMVKAHDTQEEGKLPQPKLRVITGGRDGGNNWLKSLPIGTIFICKRIGELEFIGYQWEIDWKGKRAALLQANLPTRVELPVDMAGFSRVHELVEVQRRGIDLDDGD